MQDEQTNKIDTEGAITNNTISKADEPLSLVQEAQKVRDEIKAENDRREEILKKEEALASERLLGGTSGGHVDPPVVNPEDAKKAAAKEFFKGTQLAEAIDKL